MRHSVENNNLYRFVLVKCTPVVDGIYLISLQRESFIFNFVHACAVKLSAMDAIQLFRRNQINIAC